MPTITITCMRTMKDGIVDARIGKVLALQTDSAAMCEALDSIAEFYTVNTIENRRNLRYELGKGYLH